MSSRETVIEFVNKLPEEMPLVEIAREIEMLAEFQTVSDHSVRLSEAKADAISRLESLVNEYTVNGTIPVPPERSSSSEKLTARFA